jgi:prepilin-type N-terminal cleavage/methylation domain-containing protein
LNKGFTFVELLVVIAIFGISMMFIVPKVVENYSENNPVKKQFENVINSAFKLSATRQRAVFIKGLKGSNILKIDNDTFEIEDAGNFNIVKINDNNQNGLEFYLGVYPDRAIDSFEIVTSKDMKIISDSLNMRVEIIE